MLPHSLRIVEYITGFPGSSHDQQVWAAGSNILDQPQCFLDKGEFIWVDAGYGFSPYTVGPYSHSAGMSSIDHKRFNHAQSRVQNRAEHGIAYLKQRYQCLKGYQGNVYCSEDQDLAFEIIIACMVAHTIASSYDKPEDIIDLLEQYSANTLSYNPEKADIDEIVHDLLQAQLQRQSQPNAAAVASQAQRAADRDYQRQLAWDRANKTHIAIDDICRRKAKHLREKMHRAYFKSNKIKFRSSTTAERARAIM